MPKRYEPTPELRNNILKWYKECGTYSEVARRSNLSVAIVKRIITEAKQEEDSIIVKYHGVAKFENPNSWVLINNDELVYQKYYSLLKELCEELRLKNGELQD
jgi:hypothetical protein